MSRIDVVPNGKRFKIMINFVQRAAYDSPIIANQEATKIHTNEMPHAELHLMTVKKD